MCRRANLGVSSSDLGRPSEILFSLPLTWLLEFFSKLGNRAIPWQRHWLSINIK